MHSLKKNEDQYLLAKMVLSVFTLQLQLKCLQNPKQQINPTLLKKTVELKFLINYDFKIKIVSPLIELWDGKENSTRAPFQFLKIILLFTNI